MDVNRAFSYIFKDKDWIKKVLLGGLFLIIPIAGTMFPIGYFASHFKNMKEGRDLPLPEWDKIGEKFILGLKLFVVYLLYTLPLLVLYILMFLSVFLVASGTHNNGKPSVIIFLFMILIYLLIFLYAIFLAILSPGILIKFLEKENIGDALKVAEIFELFKKNPKNFLIMFLLLIVVEFIASAGLILCFVGALFTSFIAVGIYFRLLADFYREIQH